jgi:diguanylate cyclase (GGDEF)-like protein
MSQTEHRDQSVLTQDTPPSDRQLSRKHIHLLFIGLSADEIAPLLALLRTPRISPRGRQIKTEKQFLTSLKERSWDLVICSPKESKFSSIEAIEHIKHLNKDLPVIQLIPEADSHKQLKALKNRISITVPLDEKELLLLQVRKELSNLENRRKLRSSRAALEKYEKLNLELMASSKNAIAFCSENKIIYANESFLDLFGEYEESLVLGKDIIERFTEKDRNIIQSHLTELNQYNFGQCSFKVSGLRTDQSEFVANLDLETATYQGERAVKACLKLDNQLIDKSLNEDINLVSGLFNKDFLLRQLQLIIQRSLTGGNDCGLLYILLNDYDDICAHISLEQRERFISDIATRLNKAIKHPHLLTHLENNSFAVIFFDPDVNKAQIFAEKLSKTIAQQEVKVGAQTIKASCSVGIALINDNSPPPAELIARAASAACQAQASEHIEDIKLFSATNSFELDDNQMKRVSRAVESEELKLLFQPVVSLTADKTKAHYEVLLRMLEDQEIEISPNEFRNAMSDPETAIKVDRWVIENCLSKLLSSPNCNQKNILIINLSLHCLDNTVLLNWLEEKLKSSPVLPEQLVFQLSNSDIAIAPKKARAFAKLIHKLNCKISIKHFGTAPYDKEVLRKVEAEYIKLDGLYIQELGKDKKQDEQFFALVKNLSEINKITIAPLVEDSKAMVGLWKAGVSYVQGYYLQQPRHEMDYDFFAD